MSAPPGDRARVTVLVRADAALAFAVFTGEIDRWWRRGFKFRHSGREIGTLHLEPGLGGRLFETWEVGGEQHLVETGRITAWEPPARLVLDWRNATFEPHQRTEVEVRFDAAGGGTLVTVEHRGWSSLPPDHPARHGQQGAAFSRTIGMWWSELLTALRLALDEPRR